jgi:hypothetical protein
VLHHGFELEHQQGIRNFVDRSILSLCSITTNPKVNSILHIAWNQSRMIQSGICTDPSVPKHAQRTMLYMYDI